MLGNELYYAFGGSDKYKRKGDSCASWLQFLLDSSLLSAAGQLQQQLALEPAEEEEEEGLGQVQVRAAEEPLVAAL